MNLYLLLVAPLACAINTVPSLASSSINTNNTQPLSSFDVSHHCASPAQREPGRQMPSALDCLNVLTFILATTPDHNQPTRWSRNPHLGNIILPYHRVSGSCQLVVRLTTAVPVPAVETAAFDQVIGAAMRVIEVCLLNGRPDVEHVGGAALTGLGRHLDVIVWGTSEPAGGEDLLSNGTLTLNGSDVWVDQIS